MVDDGTHGEGRDWIDQASLLDARIRLIRLPRHKGLSTALNAAIAASRGSYIARMDADDLSAPHRLQRLYDFLQAHAQYAWAGCCCRLVDEDGAWGHVRVPQEPCARDFLPHSPYIHPSVMFRAHDWQMAIVKRAASAAAKTMSCSCACMRQGCGGQCAGISLSVPGRPEQLSPAVFPVCASRGAHTRQRVCRARIALAVCAALCRQAAVRRHDAATAALAYQAETLCG